MDGLGDRSLGVVRVALIVFGLMAAILPAAAFADSPPTALTGCAVAAHNWQCSFDTGLVLVVERQGNHTPPPAGSITAFADQTYVWPLGYGGYATFTDSSGSPRQGYRP